MPSSATATGIAFYARANLYLPADSPRASHRRGRSRSGPRPTNRFSMEGTRIRWAEKWLAERSPVAVDAQWTLRLAPRHPLLSPCRGRAAAPGPQPGGHPRGEGLTFGSRYSRTGARRRPKRSSGPRRRRPRHRSRTHAQSRHAPPFRFDSYFYYLTGFPSRGGAGPGRRRTPAVLLFCREKNLEREIWDGYPLRSGARRTAFGFDEAHPIAALDEKLAEAARRPARCSTPTSAPMPPGTPG
jgi:hypothetical protein